MTTMKMSPKDRAEFITTSKGIEIPFFGVDPTELPGFNSSKYTSLTSRQYRAFMDAYRGPGGDSTQIRFGFKVVGNILKHASVAYVEHLKDSGESPDLEELEATMLEDFDVAAGFIAELDRDRAVPYETWLGLRDGKDDLFTPTSYQFERRSDGLRIAPKAENLRLAQDEADRLPIVARSCPALKFVLPKLWGIDVEGCVSDPDYFAADVESALERAKVEA